MKTFYIIPVTEIEGHEVAEGTIKDARAYAETLKPGVYAILEDTGVSTVSVTTVEVKKAHHSASRTRKRKSE